jgi:hypothetical protein
MSAIPKNPIAFNLGIYECSFQPHRPRLQNTILHIPS